MGMVGDVHPSQGAQPIAVLRVRLVSITKAFASVQIVVETFELRVPRCG